MNTCIIRPSDVAAFSVYVGTGFLAGAHFRNPGENIALIFSVGVIGDSLGTESSAFLEGINCVLMQVGKQIQGAIAAKLSSLHILQVVKIPTDQIERINDYLRHFGFQLKSIEKNLKLPNPWDKIPVKTSEISRGKKFTISKLVGLESASLVEIIKSVKSQEQKVFLSN
jgi:hypothetical protein